MQQKPDKLPVWEVSLAAIPKFGRVLSFEASTAERAGIAVAYGLLDVQRLRADVTLSAWSRNGVKVEGDIVADVVQACVVTLDPVESHMEEHFTRHFVGEQRAGRAGREVDVMLEEEDPPEILEGNTLALGPVILEHFALALEPYPRKPGAQAPPPASDEAAASPFAVLRSLRGGRGGRDD